MKGGEKMTLTPSIKNWFIVTLLAVVGILVLKFVVTKLPVPKGIQSTVQAV